MAQTQTAATKERRRRGVLASALDAVGTPPAPRGADDELGGGWTHVSAVVELPLSHIDVGENVRKDVSGLEELAASIAEHGVLSPIKVRAVGQRWTVVWGQRRTLASRLAGRRTIPAVVVTDDPPADELALEQLVENLQRADLNPLETARALQQVLDHGTHTQASLAQALGKSRQWVTNTVRLLRASEAVQAELLAGRITGSQAEACVGLPDDDQAILLKRALDGAASTELERQAQSLKATADDRQKRREKDAASVGKAVEALRALPKVTGVFVSGSATQIQQIRAAGFRVLEGHSYDDRLWNDEDRAGCDCGTWLVTLWYGTPDVGMACTSEVHKKAREQARKAAAQKQEVDGKARLEKARTEREAFVAASLEPLAQLFAGHDDGAMRLVLFLLARRHHEVAEALVDRWGPKSEDGEEAADDDALWLALRDGLPERDIARTLADVVLAAVLWFDERDLIHELLEGGR